VVSDIHAWFLYHRHGLHSFDGGFFYDHL